MVWLAWLIWPGGWLAGWLVRWRRQAGYLGLAALVDWLAASFGLFAWLVGSLWLVWLAGCLAWFGWFGWLAAWLRIAGLIGSVGWLVGLV